MQAAAVGTWLSVGAAFWGAVFLIPFKQAGLSAPRPTVVLTMLLAAAVANTIATLVQTRGRLRIQRRGVLVAVVLALCTILGNIGVVSSLGRIEPAITSVILQTQVILVAIMELVFLRERLSRWLIGGCVVALIGFALMQAPWQANHSADIIGMAWAFLGAGMFGIMLVVLRHSITHIDPLSVNALRLWMSVLLMVCWPGAVTGAISMDASIWLLALAAGLAGPTISRLMLMAAVRRLSATQTKLTTLMSPLFALGLGMLAFGTMPSGHELIGGCVLLSGVALPLIGHLQQRQQRVTPH